MFCCQHSVLRCCTVSSVTPIFSRWIFRGSWSRTWRDVHDERWRTVRRTKGLAASGLALGRIAWSRGLDSHHDKRPGGQRLSASRGGGELRLRFASCKAVPRVFSNRQAAFVPTLCRVQLLVCRARMRSLRDDWNVGCAKL